MDPAFGLTVRDVVLRGRGDRVRRARLDPWYPRTIARPMTEVRCTSSPKPFTTRPQRGSRETTIMGENVQVTPPDRGRKTM